MKLFPDTVSPVQLPARIRLIGPRREAWTPSLTAGSGMGPVVALSIERTNSNWEALSGLGMG